MKELLFSLSTVCLFSSAITFLCPSGQGGIGKALRMLCSLCICACLTLPTLDMLKSVPKAAIDLPSDAKKVENTAKNAIIDGAVEQIRADMESYVSTFYGLQSPKLVLTVDKSDISHIRITGGHLQGEGRISEAANYISAALMCKITYDKEETGN